VKIPLSMTKSVILAVALLLILWAAVIVKTWLLIQHEQRQSILDEYYLLTDQAYEALNNSFNLFNMLGIETQDEGELAAEYLAKVQKTYDILAPNTWLKNLSVVFIAETKENLQLDLIWQSDPNEANSIKFLAGSGDTELREILLGTSKEIDWKNVNSKHLFIVPFNERVEDSEQKLYHLTELLGEEQGDVQKEATKHRYIVILELSATSWFSQYKKGMPPWLSIQYLLLSDFELQQPEAFSKIKNFNHVDYSNLHVLPRINTSEINNVEHNRIAVLSKGTLPFVFVTAFDASKISASPFRHRLFLIVLAFGLFIMITIVFYVYRLETDRVKLNLAVSAATDKLLYANQTVEQQKNYLKEIINSSINGIVTASRSGIIESFSKAAEHIFGWSEQEVIGKNLTLLMPEPFQSEHDGYLHRYHKANESKVIGVERLVKGKHKNGFIIDIKLAVLASEINGRSIFIGFIGDMSETETLRFERETFFDISPELICLISADGYFKQVNQSWCNLLGYNMEELLNTPFADFLHPEDRASGMDEMNKLQTPGYRTVNFDNRYRDKSGAYHWFQWNAVLNHGNDIIYASARDVTKEKNQQQFLQQTNEKMRLVNTKLQQLDGLKSMFIATMSHELRTPLNSIIGFSSVMLQGLSGQLTGVQVDHLTRIHKASQHLLTIISDIIDVSKIEAERFDSANESFYLHEVAQEVITLAHGLSMQYKIAVVMVISQELILFTDLRRVKQVLLNLVSNAIKYSLQGQVTITASVEGLNILMSVIDQGIGIREQDIPALFKPFSRLDAMRVERSGTGLGLYLTKKIVDGILLGSITVTSSVGVGSRFEVIIPKTRDWQLHSGQYNDTTYRADY
jgi:PAS domain S-box-containing protein